MKATSIAPSNLAFIKYWGKKDEKLRLPLNDSLSMNLSNLTTITTVEFDKRYTDDVVVIDGKREEKEGERVIKHLDLIRKIAQMSLKAKVVSKNNFPAGTGLSSSASGFAALTVAGVKAAGILLSQKELSLLSRLGSGSACRSIPDGFVQWYRGNSHATSYAVSLFPSDWWEIVDVVTVVSRRKKEVSTTEGQKKTASSSFMKIRLEGINEKIRLCKEFIKKRQFTALGELTEKEALEMHAVMLTTDKPLLYWLPETVMMMRLVRKWRREGIPVYFSLNTGQDVHLLCEKKTQKRLLDKLKTVGEIKNIIINTPAKGARLSNNHLF